MIRLSAIFAVLLLFTGCELLSQGNREAAKVKFGYSYQLVNDSEYPSISNDSLYVKVAYSGCNGGHDFSFRERRTGSNADIWLYKETPDQPCRAYFHEVKTFKLPPHVLLAKNIILRGPDDTKLFLR